MVSFVETEIGQQTLRSGLQRPVSVFNVSVLDTRVVSTD